MYPKNKRGYPLKTEISVKRHVQWRESNRQTCGNSNEARIFSLGIQTPDEANTNVLFLFEHCLPKKRVFAYTELRSDYRGTRFETLSFFFLIARWRMTPFISQKGCKK